MSVSRFLCRDEREREWLMDMNRRISVANKRAVAALTLFLLISAPWLNPWSLLPILLGGATFAIAERLVARHQSVLPLMLAWPVAQGLIGVAVLINGRAHKGDLAILMFAMVGASSGFPTRVVNVCLGYTAALMVALSLSAGTDEVLHDPPLLLIPLGMLFAVTLLTAAARSSSVHHQRAAVVDHLTGMLNRTALANRSDELAHQVSLTGEPVAVVVADLDRFKAVNDEHGHATGDHVLVEVAYRLRKGLRSFDSAYRLGGEEFVLLLPGVGREEAIAVAERVRTAVRREPAGGVEVTVSLGVSASEPGGAFSFERVFAEADSALYEAKREGRDRVCARPAATPGSGPAALVSA